MHATAGWLKASLNPRLFWELLRKPRCSQHNCHWETQNGLKQPQLGASEKTSKLHRSKQPQQFLRLNSTCSQIGTSCSSAVSGNSHWVPQWQRCLFFFCWPQILCSSVFFFSSFFSVYHQGNVGKLPGELKAPGWKTDLQWCCFSSSAALAIVLNSSRGPTLSGESALSLHSSLWSLCWTTYISEIRL